MLDEAEKEFKNISRDSLIVICTFLRSQLEMAGEHKEKERDEALDLITKAR